MTFPAATSADGAPDGATPTPNDHMIRRHTRFFAAIALIAASLISPGCAAGNGGMPLAPTAPPTPAVPAPAAPAAPVPAPTATPVSRPATAPQGPERWEAAVAKFEEDDKKTPPPAEPVLFVGSSSIVGWKSLAADFPDLPVLNRGFGGSTAPDLLHYVDRLVLAYKPSRVVYYEGDNDLAAKRTPQQVRDDFATFVGKVRAALPDTPVYFLAVKPSPARWHLRAQIEETNRLVRDFAAASGGAAAYVDVYTPMLGKDGTPRLELYKADRLHMTEEGYRLWTAALKPHLTSEKAK